MQRVATAIFAMMLVVLVTAESVNAAHSRPKVSPTCRLPAHASLLLADSQAQVFESPSRGLSGPFIEGCAYGRRRAYMLGVPLGRPDPEGNEGVTREILAGTVVAYEFSAQPAFGSGEGSTALVMVRDLRSGKMLQKVPTGTPSVPRRGIGIGRALSLVVKSDGAVAWVAGALPPEGYYQVHALDGSGSRVLATGRSIDPQSLALAGSTLYWTQEGKPFSAALN
jgi:hypothetical protein